MKFRTEWTYGKCQLMSEKTKENHFYPTAKCGCRSFEWKCVYIHFRFKNNYFNTKSELKRLYYACHLKQIAYYICYESDFFCSLTYERVHTVTFNYKLFRFLTASFWTDDDSFAYRILQVFDPFENFKTHRNE